jgi:hypothetical protein
MACDQVSRRRGFSSTREPICRTSVTFYLVEADIAKNRNTYAKRQREQDKKVRAEKKRERRDQRRDLGQKGILPSPSAEPDDQGIDADLSAET